jgi:hypothetical protein
MEPQQEKAEAVDGLDGLDINSILQQVFLGNQQIVSHVGVSQFRTSNSAGTGRSACGLAALNCARTVFEKEHRGIRGERLLHEVLTRETAEVNTLSPCIIACHLNGTLSPAGFFYHSLLCRRSPQSVNTGIVRFTWTWKTLSVYRGSASHCLRSNHQRIFPDATSKAL